MTDFFAKGVKVPPGLNRDEYRLFLEVTGATYADLVALSGYRLLEHQRLALAFIQAVHNRADIDFTTQSYEEIRETLFKIPGVRKVKVS